MPGQDTGGIDTPAEQAIILQVLDPTTEHTRLELQTNLKDFEKARVDAAILSLQRAGVIHVDARTLYPTVALQRLDVLGLICI